MVLCLMLLICVSFLQLPVRGRPYHPGLYMRNFKTWKRGTKPLCSLRQGKSKARLRQQQQLTQLLPSAGT